MTHIKANIFPNSYSDFTVRYRTGKETQICRSFCNYLCYIVGMRVLTLIICLFIFSATSFVDLAFVASPDVMCLHHMAEMDNADQAFGDDQTRDQENQDECQDCCCIHNCVLTDSLAVLTNTVLENMVLSPADALYASDLSPLYRPPIV